MAPTAVEPPTQEAPFRDDAAEDAVDDEECVEGESKTDAKTLANRKKKEKKRSKKELAGGVEGGVGSPPASPQATPSTAMGSPCLDAVSPATLPSASPNFQPLSQKGPKEKEKKENPAARAARERLEQQRRLEEEKAAFEAEQRRRLEEEERLRREEEQRAEAEKLKKTEAKQAKVAKAKSEGTYLTKAQKQRAAKAAHAREMLGFSPGLSPGLSPCAGPISPLSVGKSPSLMARQSSGDSDLAPLPELAEEAEAAAERERRGASSRKVTEAAPVLDPSVPSERRSPVVCVMGHVDAGKTKLLDRIRRTNVQEREAGNITQQIGATFFPQSTLREQVRAVDTSFNVAGPGLLIIDTPGHESFGNLRSRGSSLSDIAVVVVDVMHGLELQTIESLKLLRKAEVPFIIALNKVDVIYGWTSDPQVSCIKEALGRQKEEVADQFQRRLASVKLELNERGFNAGLYWESEPDDNWISIVPTSARTGEGLPDLLYAILGAAESPGALHDSLAWKEELQCTVMEVKHLDGHGTTVDVLLRNGSLHEGDRIALAGMNGPIVTSIRTLLTPHPLREMRVKGDYIHHPVISTAMGVKISAAGLEKAVCGSEVLRVKDDCSADALRDVFQDRFQTVLAEFEKQSAGVCVRASTIGSLEALLTFLRDMQIPVADMGIGEVHKKDVKQAAIMREKKMPEYALILAFDVKVNAEAKKEAKHAGVQVFVADVIYRLFDEFKRHMEKVGSSKKPSHEPVFPASLEVYKPCSVSGKDASLVWCEVVGGQLREGTPLRSLKHDQLEVGRVVEILKDKKSEDIAYVGAKVCIKLQPSAPRETDLELNISDRLCSALSRESNEALKDLAHGEMRNADWALLDSLKKILKIE